MSATEPAAAGVTQTGTIEVKRGLAQMLKGGVIMDVVDVAQVTAGGAASTVCMPLHVVAQLYAPPQLPAFMCIPSVCAPIKTIDACSSMLAHFSIC